MTPSKINKRHQNKRAPYLPHLKEGVSRREEMNKWMTAHNMGTEYLRQEHFKDLKYEIEQPLREEWDRKKRERERKRKREREREHKERISESEEPKPGANENATHG